MWTYPFEYDVIVIGGGHAGCEAAVASAKMGASTLLITLHLDHIGKMSCNPSIGGIAKGQIVREIDALGGIMGKISDRTAIHYRMLNRSKGPAVRSPRAQIDKLVYSKELKSFLEKTKNLEIRQAKIEKILVKNNYVYGVCSQEGIIFVAKNIILASGTFMKGKIYIGDKVFEGGRAGEESCNLISDSLKEIGLSLDKLKTGTPPRINANSIDYSYAEEQPGEKDVKFSYDNEPSIFANKQISCHITYTTIETKEIIQKNLHKSPLISKKIQGIGPRYCPSLEDKIVRFAHKDRHQLFLEPEGIDTNEVYVNGLSTSLPIETQMAILSSIPALRDAKMMRPAYAIEYDYVTCNQILPSLECKQIKGLFLAGQINGTTGYEEASAQGLIAGINAANNTFKKPPFILSRTNSYIGVLIDDLMVKELDEPYRMFTSRAEHRLLLRQDNADLRLRSFGYDLGLISKKQNDAVLFKKACIEEGKKNLSKVHLSYMGKRVSLSQLLCRPEITYTQLLQQYSNDVNDYGDEINEQIEIELKYEGYIRRQQKHAEKLNYLEKIFIPHSFSFSTVKGLKNEALEKLSRYMPTNLQQASRIDGVSPADISILLLAIEKHNLKK